MANKREFKKSVEAVGASIVGEMMDTYYTVREADKEAIEKAIAKVLGATAAAKSNSNVFFDRGMKSFDTHQEYGKAKGQFFRALFNKISKDFSDEVNAALKEYNAAIPASVKAENKAAVN